MNGGMMDGFGWGMGLGMGVFWLLVIAFLVAGIVFFVRGAR